MEIETSANVEREQPKPSLDVLVVLGAKPDMKNGEAVLSFAGKIRTAAAEVMYKNGVASHILFVGGKTRGESQPSEAKLMADYFKRLHNEKSSETLSNDALIVVEKSTDTDTNLNFAFEEIKNRGLSRSGILTNEFHLPRVMELARLQGLNTLAFPAEETLSQVSEPYRLLMESWNKSPEVKINKSKEGLFRFVLLVDPKAKLSHAMSSTIRK